MDVPLPRRRWLVPQHIARAAAQGDVHSITNFLQQNNTHVNARTINQSTLLHVAARYGQVDIVHVLVHGFGCDVEQLDYVR